MKYVKLCNVIFGNDLFLVLIVGLCQFEMLDYVLMIVDSFVEVCVVLGVGFIFKVSYDKVNCILLLGCCGIGMEEGLCMLEDVCVWIGCLVLIDVYDILQIKVVGLVVDVIQILVFLLC